MNDEFTKAGWIRMPSNDENYGLVKKAVNGRTLPVWQTSPDAIDRKRLSAIGNISNQWFGEPSVGLPQPGSNRSAIYVGDDGRFYQKAWDLNDYGGSGGSTAGIGGKALDWFGHPTVVTTGYQPITDDMYWYKVEPYMEKTHNYDTVMRQKYGLLPSLFKSDGDRNLDYLWFWR